MGRGVLVSPTCAKIAACLVVFPVSACTNYSSDGSLVAGTGRPSSASFIYQHTEIPMGDTVEEAKVHTTLNVRTFKFTVLYTV